MQANYYYIGQLCIYAKQNIQHHLVCKGLRFPALSLRHCSGQTARGCKNHFNTLYKQFIDWLIRNLSAPPLLWLIAIMLCSAGEIRSQSVHERTALFIGHDETDMGTPPSPIKGRIINEKNKPVSGTIIAIKGTQIQSVSDLNGFFQIPTTVDSATLVITSIGYDTRQIQWRGNSNLGDIVLRTVERVLDEVQIVRTGYQSLKRDKTVGSFVQIDSNLIERTISTNVLDRIKDIAPGVYFQNKDPQLSAVGRTPNFRNTGIIIRGESTLSGSKEPLIILDNFPYEGELRNINPNDVESVTILKDASSAAIWGANSGNGVIVITTKKGKFNQKPSIELKSNITIIDRPDLFYSPNSLKADSYIEVEKYLYKQGYFDAQLNDGSSFPTVSPVVELLKQYDLATNETAKMDIERQLDLLSTRDVRQDYEKYVYQKAVNQQYAIALRGGTDNATYTLSVGYDKNKDNLIRNGYQRTTINTQNSYRLFKKVDLTGALNYSQSTTSNNNAFGYGAYAGVGGPYLSLFPYANLVDGNGNANSIPQGFRRSYLDSVRSIGFLDWNYRPLDEIRLADNNTKVKDLLLRVSAEYPIIPQVKATVNYQNEYQTIAGYNHRSVETYHVRNLVNQFSTYDPTTGMITYNFPKNGILDLQQTALRRYNLRGQLNYTQAFNKNDVNILIGAELGETKVTGFNRTSYGYDESLGLSTDNINYGTFYPINPTGSGIIPAPDGSVFETLNRAISYFAIGNYTYDNKYILNLTARKDGANLFGAKANDKIKPFLSAGLGWNISKEGFYNLLWLPSLRLRMSYGYQGNTNQNSSAFLSGSYAVDLYTSLPTLSIETPPNPRLQWENVRNMNLGLDFVSKNGVVSGTIELYRKNAQNLVQPTMLAPQTGFSSYLANTASTETKGVEVTLTGQVFKGPFNWNSTLLFSGISDKVVKYDVPRNAYSITIPAGNFAVGKPLNALFSYRWAGLDPENGNPRGYLNGQISEDYRGIINNYNIDSLVFNGSRVPTKYGAWRNDFSYKGFRLSVNISYRFGYVFRRSTTSLNYTDILKANQHSDYDQRWQQTGDETRTNIPSLLYPSNSNRNMFFRHSETLVESGDHIRLQDIRLSYQFTSDLLRRAKIADLNLFLYANNLGIIWRKNKLGIDPSAVGNTSVLYPMPPSISLGLSTKF